MKKSKNLNQKLLITTHSSGHQIIIKQTKARAMASKIFGADTNNGNNSENNLSKKESSTFILDVNDISNPIRKFTVQNLIRQLQYLISQEIEDQGSSQANLSFKRAISEIFKDDYSQKSIENDEELFTHLGLSLDYEEQTQNGILKQKKSSKLDSSAKEVKSLADKDLFLQKVKDYINVNLSESEFGNIQLAKKMHLSESQLYRKIKSLTGKSVAIYIRSIRLQKAKELLTNTNHTVGQIAYKTGFNDPSYFGRTFSQEFGISPSKFRNKKY